MLASGTRLGPYEILNPLGAGGMGEVYKASDTRLNRTVAIKILPNAGPDAIARFDREARAIAALTHPHICTLYDVGSAPVPGVPGSMPFLVMEHLEGETLASRLQKGALPPDQMLAVALAIADALDKAHRAGIVHRDLKPANVMLAKAGVKLLDFGLAKLRQPQVVDTGGRGVSAMATEPAALTGLGTILGTLHYMAPEQVEGKDADHRADIWALGCLLHEMTTGRKPFDGANPATVIAAILTTDPVAARDVDAAILPLPLKRIVVTCLAKDPDERWQDARDVLRELRWISEPDGTKVVAAAVPTSAASRLPWVAAVVALSLLVIGLAAREFARTVPTAPTVRFTVSPPPHTTFYDFADPVRISPDGQRIAFVVRNAQNQAQIWIQGLDGEPQAMAGTEGGMYPFWSPDSRSIAFFTADALKRLSVTTQSVQTICATPPGVSGAWSRKGVIVFSSGLATGSLLQVPESGGTPVPLTTVDASRQEVTHVWPQFLDDDRLLYLVRSVHPENSGLYVSSVTAPAPKLLLPVDSNAMVADGQLFFVRQGTLWAQPFDARRALLSGEPVRVADRIWAFSGHGGSAFSVSDGGSLIYRPAAGVPTELTWLDRNGKRLGSIGEPAEYNHVALSPDDGRVAIERLDPKTSNGVIWLHDVARNVTAKVSPDGSWSWSPVWSPDGTRIAFSATSQVASGVYEKSVSGATDPQLLFNSSIIVQPTDWSRDGRWIVGSVLGTSGTTSELWAVPLIGDRKPAVIQKTSFNENEARLSPDGRWLAYASNEAGRPDVYVRSFPGGDTKRLVSQHGGRQPAWRRDGRELFYRTDDGDVIAVDVNAGVTFEAGASHVLFRARIQKSFFGRYDYAVTSDGQRFLMNLLPGDATAPVATVILNWRSKNR